MGQNPAQKSTLTIALGRVPDGLLMVWITPDFGCWKQILSQNALHHGLLAVPDDPREDAESASPYTTPLQSITEGVISMIGPIPYIGGKNRLAAKIITLFPEHATYVEAFAGGAQVFFRKEPSKVEVLNDKDYEVVNFFRCCQSHYEELVRYLRFNIASRRWFEILNATDPATLTDIQRAARFLYLQKNCFGGLVLLGHKKNIL
jgi:hypothetical protein